MTIGIRLVAIAVLLALARVTSAQTATPSPTPTVTPTGVILKVLPATVAVTIGQAFDVTVQVVAGAQPIDGAGGYIDFDPAVLHIISAISHDDAHLPVPLGYVYDPAGTADCSGGAFSGYPTGTFTLCTIHFQADAAASSSTLAFHSGLPRRSMATRAGVNVTAYTINGAVGVSAPPPTSTPVPPTTTPTPGGPTWTPVSPGPTPACCGDCFGSTEDFSSAPDGIVDSVEYALCIQIAAGTTTLSACPQCDCNGDGVVDSADVYGGPGRATSARQSVLNGCPASHPAVVLPRRALNPNDTDAQVNNQLVVRGSAGRVPIIVPLLTAEPTPADTGLPACRDDPANGIHRCCYYKGGVKYCSNFSPTL